MDSQIKGGKQVGADTIQIKISYAEEKSSA